MCLTRELQYVAKCQGVAIPFLPVSTKEERDVFRTLMLEYAKANHIGATDFDRMSIDWVDKVNGTTVMPKLPAYLRAYYKKFEHSLKISDAHKRTRRGLSKLATLNARTAHPTSGTVITVVEKSMAASSASALTETTNNFLSSAVVIVGGVNINPNSINYSAEESRKRGRRSGTSVMQKSRSCTNCTYHEDVQLAEICPGRFTGRDCTNVKGIHSGYESYIQKRRKKEEEKKKAKEKQKQVDENDTA